MLGYCLALLTLLTLCISGDTNCRYLPSTQHQAGSTGSTRTQWFPLLVCPDLPSVLLILLVKLSRTLQAGCCSGAAGLGPCPLAANSGGLLWA